MYTEKGAGCTKGTRKYVNAWHSCNQRRDESRPCTEVKEELKMPGVHGGGVVVVVVVVVVVDIVCRSRARRPAVDGSGVIDLERMRERDSPLSSLSTLCKALSASLSLSVCLSVGLFVCLSLFFFILFSVFAPFRSLSRLLRFLCSSMALLDLPRALFFGHSGTCNATTGLFHTTGAVSRHSSRPLCKREENFEARDLVRAKRTRTHTQYTNQQFAEQ